MSEGSSDNMEEPLFIKCEPEWPTASGESSAYEPSVFRLTDMQLIMKDDPQPYTYRCEDEFNGVTVKEELMDNSAANDEVKDDQNEIPVEDPFTDIIKESSADIKTEIFIDEDADDRLVIDLKEESVENDAEVTGAMPQPLTRTGETPYYCSICSGTFPGESLETHMLATHTPFKCSVCGSSFAFLDNLKIHEITHTITSPLSCSICKKNFRFPWQLRKHKIRCENRPFSCSNCGKSYIKATLLRKHMRVHDDRRPFSCTVCKKTFRTSSDQTSHEKTHNDCKPYLCSICGNYYKKASSLKEHEKRKHKSTLFSCFCGRAFSKSLELTRHEMLHINNDSFLCSLCGIAFREPWLLKEHQEMHTEGFLCSICGRSYTKYCNLRKHHEKWHYMVRPFK